MAYPRLSFVLGRSTGEPIGECLGALDRSFGQALNVPATAAIKLRLEDDLAPYVLPGLARLRVYRAPTDAELAANPAATRTLLFYGGLPPTGLARDAGDGTLTATFADPREVLARRYVQATTRYAATDQGAISWGLVAAQNARTGGDTFLIQGNTTTGVARDRTYEPGANVATVLDELSKVERGPDFDVSPVDGWTAALGYTTTMGAFNTWASQGTDRPSAVFSYVRGGLTNVRGVAQTLDDATTYATASGTNAASGAPLRQSYGSPGTSLYGLRESWEDVPDVSTTTTLLEHATGAVLAAAEPPATYELAAPLPDAPQPWVDYFLGDTIRLIVSRGAWSIPLTSVRVHGIGVTVAHDGTFDTRLVVA